MKDEHVAALVVGGVALWWLMTRDDFSRLERSATATKYGIPNKVPPELYANARGMNVILDRIEELGGSYTSVYRSDALNAHPDIKGHSDSHHKEARAADVLGLTLDTVVSDPILGLGLDDIVQYPSGRLHLSWFPEYLAMLP